LIASGLPVIATWPALQAAAGAGDMHNKLETVALVVDRGLSSQEVAKDLGVDQSTVRVWVRKAEAGEVAAPGGGPKTQSHLSAENKQLRRENAILR
jgi:transposase-like protein